MNKYELTSEILQYAGHTLHRIRALKNFGSVKVGERGGWIEKEGNLSQVNGAWVCGYAKVYDNAVVYGDAMVCGIAKVGGDAKVYGNAKVGGNAMVWGDAMVCGDAEVYGDAGAGGDAKVCGNAKVYGGAMVCGDAIVCGDAMVCGKAEIGGNAKVRDQADYIVFKNFWSSGRYFTWTRSNNKWRVGCFSGTGKELIKKAYADSDLSGREYERVVRYVESILADEKKETSN